MCINTRNDISRVINKTMYSVVLFQFFLQFKYVSKILCTRLLNKWHEFDVNFETIYRFFSSYHINNPASLYCSACDKSGKWTTVYVCVKGSDYSSLYNCCIGFWICSDIVVFWNCSDIVVFLFYILLLFLQIILVTINCLIIYYYTRNVS